MIDRRALLAAAHIAKKQLAIEDDDWRALLEHVTGKRSCADIDDRGLVKVMGELEAKGFTKQSRATASFKKSRKPQARLCWSLWGDLKRLGAVRQPTREGARHLFASLAGIETDTDPDFMSAAQLNRAIEGLKAMAARAAAATEASAP